MFRTLVAIALLCSLSSSAMGAPRAISVANGTGTALTDVAGKPQNARDWERLTPGLSPAARTKVTVDPDLCAYDVRATAGRTELTWRGVNLCETSLVTLNRRADGLLWVDYD